MPGLIHSSTYNEHEAIFGSVLETQTNYDRLLMLMTMTNRGCLLNGMVIIGLQVTAMN